MAFWMANAACLVVAYLLGSIPTGYLAGKLLKGLDIRQHGSKSTGATNVLRTLGKGPAAAVLLIDVLKGSMAVAVIGWVYAWLDTSSPDLELEHWQSWAVCLAGLAVLVGHGRSIWLHFTGGKSAATGLGVLLALSWPVGLGAAGVFIAILAASRAFSDHCGS